MKAGINKDDKKERKLGDVEPKDRSDDLSNFGEYYEAI